ncbi:hypothetical protein ACSDR0_49465 [Streptosporangium sp. G11]|uniref:hypothetical protein n=1 Tax=Streptosporangium sp. G11 TaxID=3436926 RepID=UPI003EB8DCC1
MIFDVVLQLEADPHQSDLARGWAAEVADPLWLLGRQWQLGEHQAEDAASPVSVEILARSTPIGAAAGQPDFDPATVPAEAIIESEPQDWWTVGRRVRIGRAVATAASGGDVSLPDEESLLLAELPVPYDGLNGTGPDGRTLWRRRMELGLPDSWFGDPGPPRTEPVDLWDPAELSYTATPPAGPATLVIDRHDGGALDWFSADATGPLDSADAATTIRITPGRLRYPSAPLPRWWQIEDARVSIGGQAPDRAGLATLVLIDLIVNHSDDWFTFAVPAPTGTIATFDQVKVLDAFGDWWPPAPPPDWSLFTTTGLDPRSLVVWATARTPLVGPILDEVVIGIDEDANLVWAVEQVIAGRTMPTPPAPPAPLPAQTDTTARRAFDYLPMTPIPPHWHPYVVENDVDGRRRFVQGRAADLSGPSTDRMPAPTSDLLTDPRRQDGQPMHQLEPGAIPADGLRVERRTMLARSTTGQPVLWTQRRRQPLLTPPTFGLRFDLLKPHDPA